MDLVRCAAAAGKKVKLEEKHLNGADIARSPGADSGVQHAPLLWEILRRHPAIPSLKRLATPVLKPSGEPKPFSKKMGKAVGKKLASCWPGTDGWLFFRLLREGHLSWPSLD
jgi:hypothetical protein